MATIFHFVQHKVSCFTRDFIVPNNNMTLHGAVPRKLCDFKNISAIYNEKIITKNLKQHNIKKKPEKN